MSVVQDIEKRFETLENQWLNLQQPNISVELERRPKDGKNASVSANECCTTDESVSITENRKAFIETSDSDVGCSSPTKSRSSTLFENDYASPSHHKHFRKSASSKVQSDNVDSNSESDSRTHSHGTPGTRVKSRDCFSRNKEVKCKSSSNNKKVSSPRSCKEDELGEKFFSGFSISAMFSSGKGPPSLRSMESDIQDQYLVSQSRSPPPVSEGTESSQSIHTISRTSQGRPRKILMEEDECALKDNMNHLKVEDTLNTRAGTKGLHDEPKSVKVMKDLYDGLKDALTELEYKDKYLRNLWKEMSKFLQLKECNITVNEPSNKEDGGIDLNDISLLTAESSPERWSSTIVHVLTRLVSFLSKETYLQQWTISLEKETKRMHKVEQEVLETKTSLTRESDKIRALRKSIEEQSLHAKEEHANIVKERESLVECLTHLQERHKDVTEREQQVALALSEVQKKAADLFLRESSIDRRALDLSSVKEELRCSLQQLQDDRERLEKEKERYEGKSKELEAKEKDLQSQSLMLEKMQEELQREKDRIQKEKLIEEKEKSKAFAARREMEDTLKKKKKDLEVLEKDLEDKIAQAEDFSHKLFEREKALKKIQKQTQEDRRQTIKQLQKLEVERDELQKFEAKIQTLKQNADNALARVAKEEKEAAARIKVTEEKLKLWEDKLALQENEAQEKQKVLKEMENKLEGEREKCHKLRAEIVKERESMTAELLSKETFLKAQGDALEKKEFRLKTDMEKLDSDRRFALREFKQFTEMEVRIQAAEKNLQIKQQEHVEEVNRHAKEYRSCMQDFEAAKKDLDRKAADIEQKKDDLQLGKEELQAWRKKAEDSLALQLKKFKKGKEELHLQHKKLKEVQVEMEQAGNLAMNFIMVMDQAATKLELQTCKLESSKRKMGMVVENLSRKVKLHEEKEGALRAKEEKITAAQVEANVRSKNMELKERAIAEKEHNLQIMGIRLQKEKENMDKKLLEVGKSMAAMEEDSNSRSQALVQAEKSLALQKSSFEVAVKEARDRLEQKSNLTNQKINDMLVKEKNLSEFEDALKMEEKLLDQKSSLLKIQRTANDQGDNSEVSTAYQGRKDLQNENDSSKEQTKSRDFFHILRKTEDNYSMREKYVEQDEVSLHCEREEDVIPTYLRMLKGQEENGISDTEENFFSWEKRNGDLIEDRGNDCSDGRNRYKSEMLLRLQQEELEESERIVQEGKVQLHIAQQMVPDVSYDNRREKVVLEEERRYLANEQRRIESSIYSKDAKVEQNHGRLDKANQIDNRLYEEGKHYMACSSKIVMGPSNMGILNQHSRCQDFDATFGKGVCGSLGSENDVLQEGRTECKLWKDHSYNSEVNDHYPTQQWHDNMRPFAHPENVVDSSFSRESFDEDSLSFPDNSKLSMSKDLSSHLFRRYETLLPEASTPSTKRLENVMTSLINAQEASRNRLQRTINALSAVSPAHSLTVADVEQSLKSLSTRLSMMEEIEEGLASQLKKAYEAESPELEGMIVDKFQLLCRMEEQQSLRAEWEEDMQRQLEKISMMQTIPNLASHYGNSVSISDRPSYLLHRNQELDVNRMYDYDKFERKLRSPEWSTNLSPSDKENGISPSPLVDYACKASSIALDEQSCLSEAEHQSRRRLALSSSRD